MRGPLLPHLHTPSGHKKRQFYLLWPVIGKVLKRNLFHKIKVGCVTYAFCTDSPVTTTGQNVCHKLCHCTFHSLSVILYIPILYPSFQQILLLRPVDLGLHVKLSSMVYLLTTYEHTLFDALYFHTSSTLQFYAVIFWSKNRDLKVHTVVTRSFSLPKCKLFRIIRCFKQNLKKFACRFLPFVNRLHKNFKNTFGTKGSYANQNLVDSLYRT